MIALLCGCVGGDDSTLPDSGPDATADTGTDVQVDAPSDVVEAGSPGWFVDATAGNDSNPGTLAKPFKSIKHAFGVAKSGDTIHLLPGVFGSSTGDDFTTAMPDGVTLAAQGLAGDGGVDVTLQGGASPFVFAGSGALMDVALTSFSGSAAIGATTGTQTLSNVTITSGVALSVTGSAQMTITGLHTVSATLGSVKNTAHLTVNGGTSATTPGGFSCTDNAVLAVQNLALTGNTTSLLSAQNSCTATISNSAVATLTGTGVSTSGTCNVTLDTVNMDKGSPFVLGGGTVTLTNGTYTNAAQDVVSFSGAAAIKLTGSTFTGCGRIGIEGSSNNSVDGTNLTITGCALGGIYSQGTLKLRSSQIKNNPGWGLYGLGSSIVWDLGTGGSLGNNTFQGNSTTNVDISFVSNQSISAIGNTWNASVQGADSSGHYAANAKSGFSASGTNFKTSSNAQLLLGP